MNFLKGFFGILQDNLVQGRQKLGIFNFQSQFLRPKLNLNFMKTIFLLEYQIRITTFINTFFDLIHFWKNIFTAMNFWLHTIAILWSKIGVIPEGITYPKSAATPFFGYLQTVRDQSFSLRYYTTL